MESTLFAALTPKEEANLSGGNTKKAPKKYSAFILEFLSSKATNTVTQTANGGAGGAGGTVTLGGGKDSPVVLIKSPINANGGAGGAGGTNSSNNAVGAG